jgi:GT2 family glycosyltransferase
VIEKTERVSFEASERPRVSVVILGWKSAPSLMDCLRALRLSAVNFEYEVVVALNDPPSSLLAELESNVSGAAIIKSRVNRGFGGGCNMGVEHTKADYIVLLNDDAEVEQSWLESLVRTADEHPDAGAVGAMVLNTDGSLQEAGGLVWNEGTAAVVGGSILPADPSVLDQVRRVDYCSGVSLLVRRSSWDAVGGFTDAYYPAYYEDVDLCFKIAASGQDVLYQPAARLRHARGNSTSRRYQTFVGARNRRIFSERWATELAERDSPALSDPDEVQKTIQRAATACSQDFKGERAMARTEAADLLTDGSPGGTDAEWLRREVEVRAEFEQELEATIDGLLERIEALEAHLQSSQEQHAAALEEIDALKARAVFRLADRLEGLLARAPLLQQVSRRLARWAADS